MVTFPEGKNYSSVHVHEHAPLCVFGGRTFSLFFVNNACEDVQLLTLVASAPPSPCASSSACKTRGGEGGGTDVRKPTDQAAGRTACMRDVTVLVVSAYPVPCFPSVSPSSPFPFATLRRFTWEHLNQLQPMSNQLSVPLSQLCFLCVSSPVTDFESHFTKCSI